MSYVVDLEAVPPRSATSSIASTTSETWMYDLLWFPSPRIGRRVGSASSLRTKSIRDAVRLPRPDDVREPERGPHASRTCGSTPRACASPAELARAVGRDRAHRAGVLARGLLAQVAVDARAGRVRDPRRRRSSRHASRRLFVRNVPCQKSIDGSSTARAMSGFAARW